MTAQKYQREFVLRTTESNLVYQTGVVERELVRAANTVVPVKFGTTTAPASVPVHG